GLRQVRSVPPAPRRQPSPVPSTASCLLRPGDLRRWLRGSGRSGLTLPVPASGYPQLRPGPRRSRVVAEGPQISEWGRALQTRGRAGAPALRAEPNWLQASGIPEVPATPEPAALLLLPAPVRSASVAEPSAAGPRTASRGQRRASALHNMRRPLRALPAGAPPRPPVSPPASVVGPGPRRETRRPRTPRPTPGSTATGPRRLPAEKSLPRNPCASRRQSRPRQRPPRRSENG